MPQHDEVWCLEVTVLSLYLNPSHLKFDDEAKRSPISIRYSFIGYTGITHAILVNDFSVPVYCNLQARRQFPVQLLDQNFKEFLKSYVMPFDVTTSLENTILAHPVIIATGLVSLADLSKKRNILASFDLKQNTSHKSVGRICISMNWGGGRSNRQSLENFMIAIKSQFSANDGVEVDALCFVLYSDSRFISHRNHILATTETSSLLMAVQACMMAAATFNYNESSEWTGLEIEEVAFYILSLDESDRTVCLQLLFRHEWNQSFLEIENDLRFVFAGTQSVFQEKINEYRNRELCTVLSWNNFQDVLQDIYKSCIT
jgi:hypothetical protein